MKPKAKKQLSSNVSSDVTNFRFTKKGTIQYSCNNGITWTNLNEFFTLSCTINTPSDEDGDDGDLSDLSLDITNGKIQLKYAGSIIGTPISLPVTDLSKLSLFISDGKIQLKNGTANLGDAQTLPAPNVDLSKLTLSVVNGKIQLKNGTDNLGDAQTLPSTSTPVKGVDYFTATDISDFKNYINAQIDSILGGEY